MNLPDPASDAALVTVPAPHDVIAAWPEDAQQLFLLFHTAGEKPSAMLPLAQRLAQQFPQGIVASVAAPHKWDEDDSALQWYSARGLEPANFAARLRPAAEEWLAVVQAWQRASSLGPERTALICHGQAGTVALEALTMQPPPAARLFVIGAEMVTPPAQLADTLTLHWLHGKGDETVPYAGALRAADVLRQIDADFSVDVQPDTGHAINEDIQNRILHLLQNHVPRRIWREALASAELHAPPPSPPDGSVH